MRRCHECGAKCEFDRCLACSQKPALSAVLVPKHVPVFGYMTPAELHARAIRIAPAVPSCVKPVSRSVDWFSVSMKTVKYLGTVVTCLVAIFLAAVLLKAIM